MQREVVEDVELPDEVLLAQAPGRTHGGERSPAVVLAEGGGPVAANRSLNVILVGEGEVGTSVERDHAERRAVAALHGIDTVDLIGIGEVVVFERVVVEVLHGQSKAVVAVRLLPRVAGHESEAVQAVDGRLIVAVGLKDLLRTEVGASLGLTIGLDDLRLGGMIDGRDVLHVGISKLCGPGEPFQDREVCLAGDLRALLHIVHLVLVNHRHWVVVVGRTCRTGPGAVGVSDRLKRRVVDHGVGDGHATFYAAGHVVVLCAAVVHAESEVQPVVEHFGLGYGACAEAVHVGRLDDPLAVHVVETDVVARLVVAPAHGEVVVMAESGPLHLFLPVSVGFLVIGQREVVGLGVVAQVVSCGEFGVPRHALHSEVAAIADVGGAVLAFLRGDDDDAVGRF